VLVCATLAVPADLTAAQQPGAARAASEQVDGLTFTMPDGWRPAKRFADEGHPGVILGKNGFETWDRFVNVMRHPGFPSSAYTPDDINQTIIRFSIQPGGTPHRTQQTTIGQDKRTATWTWSSSGGVTREHVLFWHAGRVFMISTAYRAGDQETRDAFWNVVHSTNADGVTGTASRPANGAAPPAPANPNRSTKGRNAAGASSPRAPQATPKVAGASTDRSKDDARSHLPTAGLYQLPGVPKAGARYRVIKVEDGDTVWIEANGKTEYVRLLGVDAAELTFKPEHAALDAAPNRYGPRDTVALANEQREFLRGLVEGKEVSLSYGRSNPPRDNTENKRVLAYLRVGNTDVNAEMTRQGYTYDFRADKYSGQPLPHDRMDEFSRLVHEAQAAKRGVWGQSTR